MLKAKDVVFVRDRNSVPGIVHHAENAPVHVTRLKVHALVHGADKYILRCRELGHGDVDVPETPAEAALSPIHVQGSVEELLREGFPIAILHVIDVG